MSTKVDSDAAQEGFFLETEEQVSDANISRLGRLVGVNENGEPLVEFDEHSKLSPVVALNALSVDDVASIQAFPVKVMLTFESEKGQPIISGLIKNTLFSVDVLARQGNNSDLGLSGTSVEVEKEIAKVESNKPNALYTEIDGKKIILTGREEILLKCGKSSILMRRDGKIVIKGDDITSRSSSRNKIKGSSVSIN